MRLPNTTSLMAEGLDNETLVVKLDLMGIAVSTGSACSTGSSRPSHVLAAMGLTAEQSRATIRISLGRATMPSEIERAVDAIADAIGPTTHAARGRTDAARKVS